MASREKAGSGEYKYDTCICVIDTGICVIDTPKSVVTIDAFMNYYILNFENRFPRVGSQKT